MSPEVMLGPICGHLAKIYLVLQGSLPAHIRQQLQSLAGETAGLAGWLMWELDDGAAATEYFRRGLDAANEANDATV